MSESHDQSYYEIALTNRQVMSIFVVLLVCVLVSFLGGVWLGRGADASVEMASTQAIVGAEGGEAPLEQLDFFTRSRETGDAGKRAAGSAGDLAKDPGPMPKSPGAASAAIEPRAEPAARASSRALAPVQPAGEPTRPRADTASGQKVAEPVIEAPAKSGAAAPASETVVIQVFSSNDKAQANRVVEQLRRSGYPAILSPVDVAGRTLHRVRIGPYTDPDEAKVVAESVSRSFKLDTWITH